MRTLLDSFGSVVLPSGPGTLHRPADFGSVWNPSAPQGRGLMANSVH